MSRWPSQSERFWLNVTKTEGCWLWVGRTQTFGYGRLRWNGNENGAHRVSWLIHFGPIPNDVWVLHKCDTPACVRPDHLFLGTHAENMRDCLSKGRFKFNRKRAYGEDNRSHKLTAQNVEAIRSLGANGMRHEDIAKTFVVNQSTVTRIINRARRRCG